MEIDFKKELNEQQFKAVSSSSKYLRIVAGAGSGKTRVLVYRIMHLISAQNVEPYRILAITFTNKAAGEMRERVAKYFSSSFLQNMCVLTFHSFCALFLRKEIGALGRSSNFTIMDDEDQKALVKNICKELFDETSKDFVFGALNFISFFEGENKISSEVPKGSFRFPDHKKFLEIFKIYEQEKLKTNNLDFDDLLNLTVRILRNFPDVQRRWSQKFRHILIDEFQDTNDVQFELLNLLVNHETSVFVVGDPDQAIYGWRGANTRLILEFEHNFKGCETIILNENYRSTKNILDTANKLISNNKERVKKDLYTNKSAGDDVLIKRCYSRIDEGRVVADLIEQLIDTGKYKYKDMAILYRTSYCSNPIEKALVSKKIPLKMYGGTRFYKRVEIKDLVSYFSLFVNHNDDIAFLRIINVPRRKIGDSSISIINNERRAKNLSIYEYLKQLDENNTELKKNTIDILKQLIFTIDEYATKLEEDPKNYPKILEEFIFEIGYAAYLNTLENAEERQDNVNALIQDLNDFKKEYPEESFHVWLQNALLTSYADDMDPNADCVSLMTVHVAKGLEFKVVFVVSINDGIFPHQKTVDESANGIEEERRLFYVALTRAQERLFLSYNSDMNYSYQVQVTPSIFLKELGYLTPSSSYSDDQFYEARRSVSFGDKYRNSNNFKNENNNDNFKEKSNNIIWEVNDICEHTNFGVGTIVKIEGDEDNQIITVQFIKHGKKLLVGNHPSLRKVKIG